MKDSRFLVTAAVVCLWLLAGATSVAKDPRDMPPTMPAASQLPIEGTLPSLEGATEWLNTQPLTMDQLRGKVVVVEFWTYTCINWRRTLPYVRAWSERYRPQGLVVIGVHTPEFGFEKDVGNVRRAVREIGIAFPVAVDSDYTIWTAFRNQYWPALYFVDAGGRIRHHHFGEGGYDQSEIVIQQLLTEAGHSSASRQPVAADPTGVEAPADWANLRSPETYLGYQRSDSFASVGSAALDRRHNYEAPENLKLNEWALTGNWTLGTDSAVLSGANGRLAYRFHARDVNLIMSPPAAGNPVHFRVLIDGRPPGNAHGSDTDVEGNGVLTEPRMYQLIRQGGPIQDQRFEIQFFDSGVAAYDFTFG
jgi:thiol-disulfide isomerase/thioredoxin